MADPGEGTSDAVSYSKPLVRAGVALGLGLGGFFDGIVVHPR